PVDEGIEGGETHEPHALEPVVGHAGRGRHVGRRHSNAEGALGNRGNGCSDGAEPRDGCQPRQAPSRPVLPTHDPPSLTSVRERHPSHFLTIRRPPIAAVQALKPPKKSPRPPPSPQKTPPPPPRFLSPCFWAPRHNGSCYWIAVLWCNRWRGDEQGHRTPGRGAGEVLVGDCAAERSRPQLCPRVGRGDPGVRAGARAARIRG